MGLTDTYPYVLSIICNFTRYVKLVAMKKRDSTEVADALYDSWFMLFGFPDVIAFDGAKEFKAKLFKRICERAGIEQRFPTAYSPQTQGKNERFHATLGIAIRALASAKRKSYHLYLREVE